jgi:hypothetical protein
MVSMRRRDFAARRRGGGLAARGAGAAAGDACMTVAKQLPWGPPIFNILICC